MDRNEMTTKYWSNIANQDENNKPEKYLLENSKIVPIVYFKNDIEKIKDNIILHEIGCNVGKNLVYLRNNYKNIKLSGNDINSEAINLGLTKYWNNNEIYLDDTFNFINNMNKNQQKIDILISMAHLEHIPPVIFYKIAKLIPKICNKFYLYEIYHLDIKDESNEIRPKLRKIDTNWGIWQHPYIHYFGNPSVCEKINEHYYKFIFKFN